MKNLSKIIFVVGLVATSYSYAIPFNLSYGTSHEEITAGWQKKYSIKEDDKYKTNLMYCGIHQPRSNDYMFNIPLGMGLFPEYLTTDLGRQMYLSGRNHPMSSPFIDDQEAFILSNLFDSDEFKGYLSFYDNYQKSKLSMTMEVYKDNGNYKCLGFISDKLFHVSITSSGYKKNFYQLFDKVKGRYNEINSTIFKVTSPNHFKSFYNYNCVESQSCHYKTYTLNSPLLGEEIVLDRIIPKKELSFFSEYKNGTSNGESINYTDVNIFNEYKKSNQYFINKYKSDVLPKIMRKIKELSKEYNEASVTEDDTF